MNDILNWNRGVLFLGVNYFMFFIGLISRADGLISKIWLILIVFSAIFSASCFVNQAFSAKNERRPGVLIVMTLSVVSPTFLFLLFVFLARR
ncbi:MAG: hypothetical protein AB1403_19155 [Candidatus Riflebacteria bacterium]